MRRACSAVNSPTSETSRLGFVSTASCSCTGGSGGGGSGPYLTAGGWSCSPSASFEDFFRRICEHREQRSTAVIIVAISTANCVRPNRN
uniref:Uncharacterized protein n=1 Tax=Globodera rostochiensis TaxID=31243 RepID=A0A914H9T3_GLORO